MKTMAKSTNALQWMKTAFGLLGLGLLIFVLAAITSLSAELSARLIPIFILPIILSIGLLSRNSVPLTDKFKGRWLVLLVIILILWPTYFMAKIGGLPTIDPRKFMAGGGIAVLIFILISRSDLAKTWKEYPTKTKLLAWTIGILALLRIAAAMTSTQAPMASLIMVMWEVVYYYSMFYVALFIFNTPRQQELFRVTLISLGIIEGFYAAFERVSTINFFMKIAPRIPENADFFAGEAISRWRDGAFRAQGTFAHPLLLSEFGAFLACLSASMIFFSKRALSRYIGLLGLFSGCLCVYVSGSRTGFLATGAGVGIIGIAWICSLQREAASRRLMFVLLASAAIVVSIPAVTLLSSGKTVSERHSSAARQIMVQRGLPSVVQHPVLGTGPGTAPSIAGILGGNNVLTLDSYLLAIGIDSGVPVLILFVFAYLGTAWISINNALSHPDLNHTTIYGCSAALISLFIFRIILATPDNMSLAFLTIGILATTFPKKAAT